MKNYLFSSNLRYLAPDTGATDTGANDTSANAKDGTGSDNGKNGQPDDADASGDDDKPAGDEKKYSDKQVDDLINQKFAEWKAAEAKKADQAKKLAGMSEKEKAEATAKQAQDEAAAAKAELAKYNMRDTARKMLTESNVAVTDEDLALITTADADTTKANVNQFIDFAKRVQKQAEQHYLSGEQLHAGSSKPEVGTRGAELAKIQLGEDARPNPYFHHDSKTN